MKKIIYILSIAVAAVSCNSLSESEKSIQEYMRSQTGSPDLKIEFTNVEITRQTVQDSIDILQKIFEEQTKEKADAIQKMESSIENMQKEQEKTSKSDPNYDFYRQFISMTRRDLQEWQNKVITNEKVRYDGQDPQKIIATLVRCEMTSLINPVLKAKQTKEGLFVLTPEETKCLRQVE